jgi:hypothetical protein
MTRRRDGNSHECCTPPVRYSENANAIEALEAARQMPPGALRIEALRQAGLLRHAAELDGVIFAKRGRPRK